jgi:hypothetical protein
VHPQIIHTYEYKRRSLRVLSISEERSLGSCKRGKQSADIISKIVERSSDIGSAVNTEQAPLLEKDTAVAQPTWSTHQDTES